MALEKFIPHGNIKANNQEFISISTSHIRFSSEFAAKARITLEHGVCIYVDQELNQIHFEFVKGDTEDSMKLTQPKNKNNYQCSAVSLLGKYQWIAAVAEQREQANRKFKPIKIGKNWVVELSPAFDQRYKRVDSNKIPSSAKGIYRYLRSTTNELVYIGKGEIKKRLASPDRKKWDFDIVEFSLIKSDDDQLKWESYWLDKFQKENKKLPFYNNIGGKKQKIKSHN